MVKVEVDKQGKNIVYKYYPLQKKINALISYLLSKQPAADFIIRGKIIGKIWTFLL